MTAQSKTVIKSYFETGDRPTQAQFVDLIDSYQDIGAGGAVSGPASSVDSQIALFSGTSGTVLKAATTTGLLKATSGVLAMANSGTDYAPPTSGSSFLKGNGSGGFTNQTSINLSDLSTQGGATLVANATGGSAAPTAVAVTSDLVLSTTLGVNTGTGANQIVKLNGSSQLPAVDGSLLTGIGSAYVLLSTQTASTSASLNFTSVITSAYDYYVFILQDLRPAGGAVDIWMRTSVNNGSSYEATGIYNYYYQGWNLSAATAIAAAGAAAANQFNLSGTPAASTNASDGYTGFLQLMSPNNTTRPKSIFYNINGSNGTTYNTINGSGMRSTTTAVNAVQFLMSTGNITSGKIYCYGVKNT